MYIDKIKYIATGLAAQYTDIVTLYIYFYRNGEFVDSAMISGHSIPLSGSVLPIAPVEADSMAIEAVDLDFDQHILEINGVQYPVPKTGSKSIFFKTASLLTQQVLEEIPDLPPATPVFYAEPVPAAIAGQPEVSVPDETMAMPVSLATKGEYIKPVNWGLVATVGFGVLSYVGVQKLRKSRGRK